MTISVKQQTSKVLAKDSQNNAAATASVTPDSNQVVHVTGLDASYSVGSVVGLLQIKDDTTVIWEQYVIGSANIDFSHPLIGTQGKSVSVVLAASGTAGQIGKVNLRGYLW